MQLVIPVHRQNPFSLSLNRARWSRPCSNMASIIVSCASFSQLINGGFLLSKCCSQLQVQPLLRKLSLCRSSSNFSHLKEEMTSRKLPLIYDDMVPGQSYRLEQSLASFLPASWTPASPELPNPSSSELPPTHHLVYFNPAMPADELLPDGTDPLQSPGPPFVRRMWAGGYLRFS